MAAFFRIFGAVLGAGVVLALAGRWVAALALLGTTVGLYALWRVGVAR